MLLYYLLVSEIILSQHQYLNYQGRKGNKFGTDVYSFRKGHSNNL